MRENGSDVYCIPLQTFYDAVGGHDTFVASGPPLLRRPWPPTRRCVPCIPKQDLGPAEERLRMFLEQYWGGPTTYSEQRGHPRLRMRHAPFAVTPGAAGPAGCGTCATPSTPST